MKFKKIILMSSSIVGLGVLIPTAIRVNQYNLDNSPTQLHKTALSNGMKIAKPTITTAPVTFTGVNGYGTYKAPSYKNTTVRLFDFNSKPINKPENDLSNYPDGSYSMYVGFTPNKGYTWNDGLSGMCTIQYTVSGLTLDVPRPSPKSVPVTFTGVNGHGTYKAPTYKNTTVQLFDFSNRPINKPETNLSNWPNGSDAMYVGFTPNKGYAWSDDTRSMIEVNYVVHGLPTGITKPTTTTAPVTFTGMNYSGTYKAPTYKNTTVQLYNWELKAIDKPVTNLSNSPYYACYMFVGYTPNKGYFWSDGSKKMIKVKYVVHGLPTGVTKPTTTTAPVTFTGMNYSGTYKAPTYKNTTVQLFDSNNKPIDKPLINLSNNNNMYVGYTPNKGYAWSDGSKKMIKVKYVVHGLPTGVTKPTTTNAPVKFTGINYSGTYKAPTYKNTTVQLFDFSDRPINKPESDLSNWPYGMDEIYAGYTPNKGYSWNDGTNKMIQVEYVVHGLPTGVTKPTTTTAPVTFTGMNYSGTYKAPTYKNTTVQLFDSNNKPIDKPLINLSNNNNMYVGYTPNKGYSWNDGTNKMIKVKYVVHGLPIGVTKPTTTTAPVTFTGSNHHGTFNAEYKNTTVQYYDVSNNPVKTPPTNIINGENLLIGYTPNKGCVWDDGGNQIIHLIYTVEGLLPYPVPSLNDNQYGYSKSSEPHDNWTYDLGIGTNDLKKLIGTTYSYTDGGSYYYQHKAGDAFGVADARRDGSAWKYGVTYYNQLPVWYFNTSGASKWDLDPGLPRFSDKFDSDMSGSESIAFSTDFVQNQISYGPFWKTAYKNHEGVIIHFHTWYTDWLHSAIHYSVSIKVASQSLWNKTFG